MSTDSLKQKKELTNTNLKVKDNVRSNLESVVTIGGVIIFAFLVTFVCKKIMGEEETVNITTNKAEQYFYDKKYDEAIKEYEKLQEKEEWPEEIVKQAQVYSVKGEKDMCNRLLAKAYDTRNKLIYTQSEKYRDDDGTLGSEIALTALINGDVSKALEYGEVFLLENSNDKELQNTMVIIYIESGELDKAKDIINSYSLDESSVSELIRYSKMNIIAGNLDTALNTLKKAWYLDKDEVQIFNIMDQLVKENRVDIYEKLTRYMEEDSEDIFYKVMLIKYYSMFAEESENGLKLFEEIENEDIGNIMIYTVKATLLENSENSDLAEEVIDNILKNKEENYLIDNIMSWKYYKQGNYTKALEYAKYSVIKNPDYAENYGVLIPRILLDDKSSEMVEPYLREGIYKDPTNYNILRNAAEFYNNTAKKQEKAYEMYSLLAGLYGVSDNYYNMALIKKSLEKTDEAIELYKKAIELDGSVGEYHRDLGALYLQKGENDKGIKEIRNAYSINKNDIISLNNAAFYYIKVEGDIERGLINLKSAYEGINEDISTKLKEVITANYNKAKAANERYKDDKNEAEIKAIDIELYN
ncbi:tetratricopeptide repeat protein [uncultured Clostridium sp.]|uniref:tetratricopeptide repeat protein n=1 Tax=uncultured Clostridium sp. TaxID=59620 RepID=UPI0025FEF357|nr:tetratricopeptide repeat protein [uncultured Clostridium sp.]